uniref:Uncharacterized protein n=1 Tax=viral metagenome TaxID=1070528 RepID=A0A6C0EV97_9ZZZZ
MSIVNYFGKIKSKYEPFEYPYVYKGNKCTYNHNNTQISHRDSVSGEWRILISNKENEHKYNLLRSQLQTRGVIETNICVNNINETFHLCLDKINEFIFSINTIDNIDIAPPLNMIEILILKISGLDLHVKHLDKTNKPLMDDMTLLQNKLILIETQINLYKKKEEIRDELNECFRKQTEEANEGIKELKEIRDELNECFRKQTEEANEGIKELKEYFEEFKDELKENFKPIVPLNIETKDIHYTTLVTTQKKQEFISTMKPYIKKLKQVNEQVVEQVVEQVENIQIINDVEIDYCLNLCVFCIFVCSYYIICIFVCSYYIINL